MLAARTGLAGVLAERGDEEDPLADVILAVSASTGAILALLDFVLGAVPITAVPCLVILGGHVARARRIGIAAAAAIWLRVLPLTEGAGAVTPLLMIGLCCVLVVGPGRVLDWAEVRWAARTERLRFERLRREREAREADGIDAIGWIEDLPDGR